jgi:hypothetical protein
LLLLVPLKYLDLHTCRFVGWNKKTRCIWHFWFLTLKAWGRVCVLLGVDHKSPLRAVYFPPWYEFTNRSDIGPRGGDLLRCSRFYLDFQQSDLPASHSSSYLHKPCCWNGASGKGLTLTLTCT